MDHRPRFHFSAPRHWLNDPNGIVWWRGRWHLHYQHNPHAARWGDIHWGHASSDDLLHWHDEPIALAPSAGADEDGCFSGSIAIVDGRPLACYTGLRGGAQSQCFAVGDDDLRQWTKEPGRTIAEPPEGVAREDFRDPWIFRAGGWWYLAVGASAGQARGQVLLYRSADARDWHYRHPLFTAPTLSHGVMWECPNFFPLGERWVLTVSVWPRLGAHWFVGRFDDERFVPETEGVLDPDGGAFAHLAAPAPDGRMLQWAWIDEQRDASAVEADGWAGALSVPHELSLDTCGRLLRRPAAEIARLREAPADLRPADPASALQAPPLAGAPLVSAGAGTTHVFSGRCLDLEVEFRLRDRRPCGLVLAASPDGAEQTRIVFLPEARRLLIERARSSTDPAASRQNVWIFHERDEAEPLRLRVLLDHSVLEVQADERSSLSTRLYPARPDSVHGRVFADGPAQVSARGWTMRTALPGRVAGAQAPANA